MFTQWALRPDSGGPGMHRGGLGAIYEIEALADGGAEVFLLGERGKYPPFGVNGGGPRRSTASVYETDDGEATPPLVSKVTDVKIARGPEACGWRRRAAAASAIRAARDPARVARDVRLGYVSREAARRDYGVVARRRSLDADAPSRRAGMSRAASSSASTSAAPSPTCSCSTRHAARSAPPRCRRNRGDEADGFLERPARARRRRGDRLDRARHHGRHQCAARAARAARSASSPRAASATCWRCAAATAAAPGACGAISSPIADRDMRARGRRAHARRRRRSGPRSMPPRSAPPRSSCSTRRQAVAIIFINAYANPDERARARSRRLRAVWPNELRRPPRTRSCPRSASSSAPRRRRSTPICSRWSAAYLGKLDAALWRGSVSPASSTSCSPTAASCRPRPRAGCRCAPRCRARPPASSPARRIAEAAGFDNRHHLRSRRHLVRRLGRSPAARPRSRRRPRSISASSSARR